MNILRITWLLDFVSCREFYRGIWVIESVLCPWLKGGEEPTPCHPVLAFNGHLVIVSTYPTWCSFLLHGLANSVDVVFR
jgi:hypothetical protein